MEALRNYLSALTKKEQDLFANRCGTSISYLRKRICDRKHMLGIKICVNIEKQTNRQVTCEELRPDIDWAFIRNGK